MYMKIISRRFDLAYCFKNKNKNLNSTNIIFFSWFSIGLAEKKETKYFSDQCSDVYRNGTNEIECNWCMQQDFSVKSFISLLHLIDKKWFKLHNKCWISQLGNWCEFVGYIGFCNETDHLSRKSKDKHPTIHYQYWLLHFWRSRQEIFVGQLRYLRSFNCIQRTFGV